MASVARNQEGGSSYRAGAVEVQRRAIRRVAHVGVILCQLERLNMHTSHHHPQHVYTDRFYDSKSASCLHI